MKWKQSLKKTLKSALIFAMVAALCGTTLSKAFASYFPIVVQHVFLDDAEKAKQEAQEKQGAGETPDTPEEPDAGEEDADASETPSLAPELKDLTSTHEIEMKGIGTGRFDTRENTGYSSMWTEEEKQDAIDAGNFSSETREETYTDRYGVERTQTVQDVTLKTDLTTNDADKGSGIGQGENAVGAAMEQLFSGENEEAALLLSELQAAMSGGSLADKYDVERKLLALCAAQGLDMPTDKELEGFYPYAKDGNGNYLYDEDGNAVRDYLDAGGRAKAAEYELNFITGFTAKFRQACEAMVKEAPEAATLELVELDSQDDSAAVQTVEDSLAANPAVSSEQAAAAAKVVADMLEVVDSWSTTHSSGTIKGTDQEAGVAGNFGFDNNGGHNYLGNAELTGESKQALLANGYKSSSLEIQVVVAMTRDKLDENGNQIKKTDNYGREYVVQEAYSKVYVSLDGENWTDADDPDGAPVDAETVFASGDVELCTYTFTHSHRETAPLRPRPGVEPEDPKDPDPKDPDPKDPDPKDPDPKDPDPKDPKPVTPPEEVPDPDVPLEELPDLPEEPPVEEPPEEVELEEPDVPLADIPETGDISGLWYGAALALTAGLAALLYQERRSKKTA